MSENMYKVQYGSAKNEMISNMKKVHMEENNMKKIQHEQVQPEQNATRNEYKPEKGKYESKLKKMQHEKMVT